VGEVWGSSCHRRPAGFIRSSSPLSKSWLSGKLPNADSYLLADITVAPLVEKFLLKDGLVRGAGVVWRSPRLTLSSRADPIAEVCQLAKMRFQLLISLLAALATLTSAVPTLQAFEKWLKGPQGQRSPDHTSPRPSITCHPKRPSQPLPYPPPRNRVCYVQSHNDGVTDDSSYILDALHRCNNGGHVVFREGVEYFIATALDLTFLEHIDLGMKIVAGHVLKD
jgi:hypothetical protein